MKVNLQHVHLFASNLDESLSFYKEMFDAEVLFDAEVAGARNVMITIGNGAINFYDQPPKDNGRGIVHHLGIETDNLEALIEKMKSKGFQFKKPITDLGTMKYVMAAGPDNILFELFQAVEG